MWTKASLVMRARFAHAPRRQSDGGHDVLVAGAAAQIARQHLTYVGLGGFGVVLEVGLERHHDAWRAKAALQAMALMQRLLQDRQLLRRAHRLDGLHFVPFHLDGKAQTGTRGPAVDQYRTGATPPTPRRRRDTRSPSSATQVATETMPKSP